MKRRIIWTERTSSDIEAIVRYIARRDPDAARRIGSGIYDQAQILLRQLMIQVRPAIERAGFGKSLSSDRQYLGESCLPVFLSDVTKVLG